MKVNNNILYSIVIAIVGIAIAFILCDYLMPAIEPVSFKNVDANFSTDLVDPEPEIFNYRALNPTVEVYVGDCTQFDEYGQCIINGENN